MRGGKTRALWHVIDQYMNPIGETWFIAWTHPIEKIFDKRTAKLIAYDDSNDYHQ